MKYERPDLEEIELELEGSFLTIQTEGGSIGGGESKPDPTDPEHPDKPWD